MADGANLNTRVRAGDLKPLLAPVPSPPIWAAHPPNPPEPGLLAAPPGVDEEDPLVRGRSAAAAPPAPPGVFSRRAPMKLIGSLASPFARKVRIMLAEKKIDYEFEVDNPWKPDSQAEKLNPLGKVPVLVLDDGTALFDSRVIVEFLDNASP